LSKPFINRSVRWSLICATIVAGLCGAAPSVTHGGRGRGVLPGAATPAKRCDEMTEHIPTYFPEREYRGTVSYPKGEMYGEAILTVKANQRFSLTAGGKTLRGQLSSETTCGYTAVALKFDDTAPSNPTQPPPPSEPAFSLRACKKGAVAVLLSREREDFNFTAVGDMPSGAPGWGRCNGRWRLYGTRPL